MKIKVLGFGIFIADVIIKKYRFCEGVDGPGKISRANAWRDGAKDALGLAGIYLRAGS
jgi:hypothetical protein